MGLIMHLVAFLFLFAFVQSTGEAARSLKSIKLNENVIYDCVDMYKQPSLSHPLLKTHKIQMKPSRSISESRTGVSSGGYEKIIECPSGTVPVMRSRQEDVLNTTSYFIPNTPQVPGSHIAGTRSQGQGPYHGSYATISVHGLNIGNDQASFAQQYVATTSNGQMNIIGAGWKIQHSIFGDGRVWFYGAWKAKNGAGCHNTACQGFVQVAKDYPLGRPLTIPPIILEISIHQDKETGNWWITETIEGKTSIDIGYWPRELFDLIADGADMVGFGGVVHASPSGQSPPMGNGNLPGTEYFESGYFADLRVIDSNYETRRFDNFEVEQLIDSTQCYGLNYEGFSGSAGVHFAYGGPGGNSCGV